MADNGTSQPLREVRIQRTGNGWWQVVRDTEGICASYRGRLGHDAARSLAEILRGAATTLDRHLPKRGSCGICGHPWYDQTHRVIDAIAERIRAGDDANSVAEDYGYPPEVAVACLIWTTGKEG